MIVELFSSIRWNFILWFCVFVSFLGQVWAIKKGVRREGEREGRKGVIWGDNVCLGSLREERVFFFKA